MKPSQILKMHEQIQKVGSINNVKSFVSLYNPKMGYPSEMNKQMPHSKHTEKISNRSIHTEHTKTKLLKNQREQLAKIDNAIQDRYIDNNLGSQENKLIIEEINNIMERIIANIESGSFHYTVIDDMYKLLSLFKRHIYKFDSYTVDDYKTWLQDIFTVLHDSD